MQKNFSIVTTTLIVISFVLAFAAYLVQAKRDLMMLQQNSYRNNRFRLWMKQSGESSKLPRLIGMGVFLLSCFRGMPEAATSIMVGLFSLIMLIVLLKAKYKKPLVFTKRAWRIYSVDIALVLVAFVLPFAVGDFGNIVHALHVISILLVICYAASYVFLLMANWLLQPIEAHINRKYYNDASSRLASMPALKVIGITGSYGKTSTKHYLNRILCEQFDVVMTPGNFNTTLGVVRTVREHLKPYNEVFIVEMGAKEIGDIKEICDLVHPSMGIITAVGPQHLESFKSIENVQATKFELVDSLPSDGVAVVNNDFPYIANRQVDNVECLRYSSEATRVANFHASDIEYSSRGTTFAISDENGEIIRLNTSLVGRHNISNLMAAVIVALRLGMDKDKIRYAVEKIQQVEHRLSIKHIPGSFTIIDDAYNSNPSGSAMALEVLSGMQGGNRIVITPGMIELGDEQYALNQELGRNIAKSADIAIIVGEYNKDAILQGLQEAGYDEKCIHLAPTFNDAQRLMLTMAKPGDYVLYENDLPDTFK